MQIKNIHIGLRNVELRSVRFLRASYRRVVLTFLIAAAVAVAANSSLVSADLQNGYYQIGNCYPNPYSYCPYNYNTPCQSTGTNGMVQCSGYLYEDPSGCIELAITVVSPAGLLSSQFYTLHNLPSSYPPIGTWVTVTGQQNQGYNFAPNGAACPGNYINVTSISQ
jgi:hypothetical protein